MRRPLLRRPRTLVALTIAIVSFGVFSSGIGSGALPPDSLPAFGVTAGDGSLSTVAELGDVNGDGFGDYAIGLPSAGAGDAGIVYVFLGHGGALPSSPTAVDLASASFTITGHDGEMLGYSIAGDDVNGDHVNDIAIGAPMAGAPGKSGGGAVYVIFGHSGMTNVNTSSLSGSALTTDPGNPTMTLGSRYDGFQQNSHTGMSLAALPDVNGDGYNDLAVGAPDADLHIAGGGGVAVLYGKPQGVHITLNDLWEKAYPYFFHIDFPALADAHAGVSIASVGDMTGDGLPDIAIGAPHADFNGVDSGSVWIISAHIAPISGCTQPVPPATQVAPGSVCPWIKLNGLTAGQGYRIDGAAAGDQLGTSLAGLNGRLAIGAAGASPNGRPGSGEVVLVPGQSNQVTRNLAVTPPLQTVYGAEAGAGLGASLAAAGVIGGSATVLAGAPGEAAGGAAYLLQIAPGTTSDLALAGSKIAPAGAGAMTASAVAAGSELHGAGLGADALVAAPGAAGGSGAWYLVGGSGTPVLPPPPSPPAPPAPPTPPPAPPTPPPTPPATPPAPPATPPAPPVTPPVTTTGGSTGTSVPEGTVTQAPSTTAKPATGAKPVVKKKKKAKLPLCPVKKPRPTYHLVKGKRVKVKPKACRPRHKTAGKA